MTHFRKKPVVIEAVQFTGANCFAIVRFMGGPWGNPELHNTDHPIIHTLEGNLTASPGDWIIKGVKGEFYPCKPDVFAATYEPVEAAPDEAKLREIIITAIMSCVGPKMVPMDHKPTIDEIERMLNSDNPKKIQIAPDGSALIEGSAHTAGDVADTIIAALCPDGAHSPAPLEFGSGKFVVTEGQYDNRHAVFITEAKLPGEVGAAADRENNPKDRLASKERVLLFPTETQAKAVADALCGISSAMLEALVKARSDLNQVGRHYPDCTMEPCDCGLMSAVNKINDALSPRQTGE